MNEEAKVVLITGAGRGIGAATARLAARAGWRVAVNYASNEAAAARLLGEIRSTDGDAEAFRADVADETAVVAMFEAVDKRFGRIHGLVNNAGIVGRTKQRVDEYDADRLARMFAVNALGTIYCAREAVKRMSTRHGGRGGAIVNVSSMAAVIGGAGEYVDYAASKGAVDSFTVGLAREVATEGIRVNAVRPGPIDTEIHASGGQPDRLAAMRGAIPMKREGQPVEVAHAILHLLSDDASYTTGSILNVSGGR